MPKQEVGSTKWLGNKMKAKGLQKLRWYCQMCQKQCRDENGFKCHRMSDGHQRQMQLFVQDPNKFMDDFSQEFEHGFMQLLSHTYRAVRVLANTVYCDFISSRHHTHMNSTIWVTLSNFVQYLGRTNQCSIDKTPKGWYIQYIDNSPEAKQREKDRQDMIARELKTEDQHQSLLMRQIENGKASGGFQESEFTKMQREEGDAPVAFAMGGSSSSAAATGPAKQAGGTAAKRERSGGSGERNVLEEAFLDSAGRPRGASPGRSKAADAKPSGGAKISVMRKLGSSMRLRRGAVLLLTMHPHQRLHPMSLPRPGCRLALL
jgi:DNA/RNA-binding protein KIN17